MREPIERYFQVGTISWMSFPGMAQAEALRKIAADDFFGAVEVCQCPDDASHQACREILSQSHLRVCYGAQPRLLGPKLNPNSLDEAEREQAERTLIEAVDEAEYLGAGGIAFLAGHWQPETREQSYNQLLKTACAVCTYAGTKGMFVELEVFDYDMDKASLIGPAPYAARFAADVRSRCPNFGLLADLSHFPTTYETSRQVVRTLRPYITHLHFGNAVVQPGCPAYGDKHPRLGFPNSANDTAELVEFLRVLRQEGFFCAEEPYVLSMEVTPFGGEDADIILANTKRVLKRAWALL